MMGTGYSWSLDTIDQPIFGSQDRPEVRPRMFRSHAGSNRAIVLLIDGESDSFAPAFAAGIAAGGRMLHVLSSDPSSIIQYSRFCSRFHHYDSGDVVGEIRKIRAAENVEVIVACSDTGTVSYTHLRAH